MATIDLYRPEDERQIAALYRRVFGNDAAEGNRLRWDWQYRRNPNCPPEGPTIWVAREGPTVVGQYAAMPVSVSVLGQEICGSWGMDVMVAPERQRQGLGEVLFRTWEQNVGAALGLGLSESSYRLFQKLRWPNVGPVPCFVKPLTRRALRRPNWPMPVNRFVSWVTLPVVRLVARARPLKAGVARVGRFGDEFTGLWERLAPKFTLAVRRDARYLNWKFCEAPHVRYSAIALKRGDETEGYAVYRHLQEARGRVTLLVDFLADPEDAAGLETLLGWVDREAKAANSDKIRAFCLHGAFGRALKHAGYFQVKSTMEFTAKINAVDVPAAFYQDTSGWHVTLGDSDQDR
jgi:GNAT superfamily N-acetyltransferase